MAWLTGWSKRKKITLTGGSSGAQTDYQIKLNVAYDSDMQLDFDDLRFTKSDGTTLIDAWLESKTDSTNAIIWAEFPTTPANTVTEDYYMYYGNSGVVSDWDIEITFLFGDDFEDGDTTNIGDLFITASNKATTDQARSGSYSIKISAGVTEYSQSMGSLALGGYKCDFYVYIISTSGRVATFQIFDNDGLSDLNSGCVCKCENGILYNYVGSWNNTGISYSSVGWKSVSILQNATNFDITFDGQTATTLGNRNTISEIDKLKIGSTELQYYDDICVRKYAANPASYGFSSEESVPTDGNPYWYYNLLKRRN